MPQFFTDRLGQIVAWSYEGHRLVTGIGKTKQEAETRWREARKRL